MRKLPKIPVNWVLDEKKLGILSISWILLVLNFSIVSLSPLSLFPPTVTHGLLPNTFLIELLGNIYFGLITIQNELQLAGHLSLLNRVYSLLFLIVVNLIIIFKETCQFIKYYLYINLPDFRNVLPNKKSRS